VTKIEPSAHGGFTLTIKNAAEGHATKSGFNRYSYVYKRTLIDTMVMASDLNMTQLPSPATNEELRGISESLKEVTDEVSEHQEGAPDDTRPAA
jgi:hypothetical protein